MTTQPPMPCRQDVYTSRDGSQQFTYTGRGFTRFVWRGAASGWWIEGSVDALSKSDPIVREMSEYLRQIKGDVIHAFGDWYLAWDERGCVGNGSYRFQKRAAPDARPHVDMSVPIPLLLAVISPRDVQDYLLFQPAPGSRDKV